MKRLRDIILSRFFTLIVVLMVVVTIYFLTEVTYLSIKSFNSKASKFAGGLLTLIESEIYKDDISLLKEALKSGVFDPVMHYGKYVWVIVTENGIVVQSNLDDVKPGYIFSPDISDKEAFAFLNINTTTYMVVFEKESSRVIYAAINPDEFKKYIEIAMGNTYIVSPGGVIITSNLAGYEGKTISSLGFEVFKGSGIYRMRDKIFIFQTSDSGLAVLVEYRMKELLANVLEQAAPFAVIIVMSVLIIFLGISSLVGRLVISPIENLVKVIEKGEVKGFKTDVFEFNEIVNSLEDLVFRFESIYNGLFLISSLNIEPEMDESELYEKIIIDFEDFIPAMFPKKLIGIVYYRIEDGNIRKFRETYYRERFRSAEDLIAKILEIKSKKSYTPAFFEIDDDHRALIIPLRIRDEFLYTAVLILKGDITRTENYAGNVLSMEFQLMLDHATHIFDLNRMATTDFLTGLKNRMYFMNRLAEECERKKRYQNGKTFGVSMVDLNFLKRTNDLYGHEAGDELIKTFADYIKNFARKSDIVGRLGGDEFGIIWLEIWPDDIQKIEKRFLKGLENLYTPVRKIKVSASIGSAVYGIDGTTPDVLLNRADERMYDMKVKMKANRR